MRFFGRARVTPLYHARSGALVALSFIYTRGGYCALVQARREVSDMGFSRGWVVSVPGSEVTWRGNLRAVFAVAPSLAHNRLVDKIADARRA